MLQGEYAYFGLLDDFALRHNLTASCIKGVESLNQALITYALVGERILVGDGYLIMHPAAQQAILNQQDSPLRALVQSDFAQVLTRNNGALEELADLMGAVEITSGIRMSSSRWYQEVYQPVLADWAELLRSSACNTFIPWPPIQMNECFIRMLELGYRNFLAQLSESEAESINSFWGEFSKSKRRRTEWEDIAENFLQKKQLNTTQFLQLMSLGNQAKQYSWVSALTKQYDSCSFRALTKASPYFSELHGDLEEITDSKREPMQLLVPVLNSDFAEKNIQNRWELLAEMVQPGHKVNILKHEFRRAMYEYLEGSCGKTTFDEAMNYYSNALSKHFKGSKSWMPITFDFAFLGTATCVGTAVGGPIGTIVGFGIGLGGIAAAHKWPGPQLFERFSTPNKEGWFSQLHVMDDQYSTSSLKVDRQSALDHLSGVREWITK